ncbi:MAG: aspartyl protease family protein [Bryobacteraceae bacterium]|nr:aspartyl protease family protein [Bryobacteraceae bacterium]
MHELRFAIRYEYDSRQEGITVPVISRTPDGTVELPAKLDTGATNCLFERSYADILGIEVEKGRRRTFQTANGHFTAFGHEMELGVLDCKHLAEVFFFEDRHIQKNVLGRVGCIQNFQLALVDHDALLYLSKYDD